MMTNNENINSALEIWRDIKIAQAQLKHNGHLDEKDLIRMAAAGGLEEAAENELEHLDSCSLCLATWSAWRRAFSVATEFEKEEDETEELLLDGAYGFLEAAATTSAKTNALVLESNCGSYRLELLPDREQPDEGLIVLSNLSKNGDDFVTVRDREGREILSGTFENGRLARVYRRLDELDLSIWTVSVK